MKKRDIIIVIVCVATALICIGLTFWGNLKNNGVLTTDAFMGVIATFIGVCATVIVGFQIASFIELRETKKQVDILQEERERLEAMCNDISKIRLDLSNAFVSIATTSSSPALRVYAIVCSLSFGDIGYVDSVAIIARYEALCNDMSNMSNSADCALMSTLFPKIHERLIAICWNQELNNYDEIIRLHYESLCLLNRFKTSEKDNK
ncbi:MAG: hypothetical protein II194_03050 [Bacteroidales bacterium]|nr:hypothetical protein [Bacteroidales bacterium]